MATIKKGNLSTIMSGDDLGCMKHDEGGVYCDVYSVIASRYDPVTNKWTVPTKPIIGTIGPYSSISMHRDRTTVAEMSVKIGSDGSVIITPEKRMHCKTERSPGNAFPEMVCEHW